jgi:CheY-like chemotaxis protein
LRYDLADNGEQALQLFQARIGAQGEEQYHAVIMDCQMPVMDGYRASREIRKLEQLRQLQETPIIALTAHALVSEREKCMRCGMNDFIAKPYSAEELQRCLIKWWSDGAESIPAQISKPAMNSTDKAALALDLTVSDNLVKLLGSDGYKSLIAEFSNRTVDKIEEMRSLLDSGDMEQLHFLTHSLKGSAANIGCMALAAISGEMDQALKMSADKHSLKSQYEKLVSEFSVARDALSDYAAKTGS